MSPPPLRPATFISLINRVKMRPRLASVAAFLCLIECHFECPDMTAPVGKRSLILPPRRAALKDKDESHESRRCDKGSRQNLMYILTRAPGGQTTSAPQAQNMITFGRRHVTAYVFSRSRPSRACVPWSKM